MRRAAVIVTAAVAALVVGFGLGQFWLAGDGGDGTAAPSELVSVTATLSPSVHVFGDPVDAKVDVLVDTREIEFGSVHLQPNFEPYEPLGPPRVERTEYGALGRARFEYRLVCLREGCDAAEARGVSDFQTGRLRYRFKGRPSNAFEAFDWPLLEVASRVADADVEEIRWRADGSTLPPVSYRVAPLGAALVLLVVALGSAGAAALLARRLWWPGRAAKTGSENEVATRSALEQAFDAALQTSDTGDSPERRRALERVARELGERGHTELAREARELAWSPTASTSEEVASLAVRVGAGVGGREERKA